MPFHAPTMDGDTIDITFVDAVHDDDPHEQAAAESQAVKQALTFRFETQVLPGLQFEQLKRDHPAPRGSGDDHHPVDFPVALIVASVTRWCEFRGPAPADPDWQTGPLDADDVRGTLWETWPQWARLELFRRLEAQNIFGQAGGLGKLLRSANG